ncbi:hypothetical protein WMY93_012442 [Mugilogobius chulae]|uniref:RRM domain-containing protein n=1 Tax=Mugilogobius chulae TaxID=88201 RepID=A0AAW0PGT2_9GOBI
MHRDCPLDCKVYVGNLGNNGNKTEIERAFGYYGPLRSVWVARNPPGFAFVEFEDPRDATDAVRELDGRTMCNCRVRVELSNGEKRSRSRGAPLHGAGVPEKETITGGEAHRPEEDPHAGEVLAAVEADPSQGKGGGRGPFLGRGTTNPQDPFHALGVAPGQMTGNECVIFKELQKTVANILPFHMDMMV